MATRELLTDSLLSATVSIATETNSETRESVMAQISTSLVAVTASPDQISDASLRSSLESILLVAAFSVDPAARRAGETSVDVLLVENLATATSNLVQRQALTSAAQAAQASAATLAIVDELSSAIVSAAIPGEIPAVVNTETFSIQSQKNYIGAFTGSMLPIESDGSRRSLSQDGIGVFVPEGAFDRSHARADDEPIDAKLIRWETNPFSFATAPNKTDVTNISLGTRVLSLSFANENGPLEIRDLQQPFVLTLARADDRSAAEDLGVQFSCAYWNVTLQEWVLDERAGSANVSITGDISCPFNHLTSVAAFVGYTNTPCYDCWEQFVNNPYALLMCSVLGGILCCNSIVAFVRFYKHYNLPPEQILSSKYVQAKQRVMLPDAKIQTTIREDCSYWIRVKTSAGGICCPVQGDPFDNTQRMLVFVATGIVSMTVSIYLFQPPGKDPECVLTCEQQNADQEAECKEKCSAPTQDVVAAMLLSAVITTPIIITLGMLFSWLHSPVRAMPF